MVTYLFLLYSFKTHIGGEHARKLKKKKRKVQWLFFFFFFWGITLNGKMLRKLSPVYAKYSKKKKALSTKISKENLLEQKSKAEPTALTDYKKSLLFGEVCPARKKKKKHSEFRVPILLRISFFLSFFYFFFHWRYGLHWKEESTRCPLH